MPFLRQLLLMKMEKDRICNTLGSDGNLRAGKFALVAWNRVFLYGQQHKESLINVTSVSKTRRRIFQKARRKAEFTRQ